MAGRDLGRRMHSEGSVGFLYPGPICQLQQDRFRLFLGCVSPYYCRFCSRPSSPSLFRPWLDSDDGIMWWDRLAQDGLDWLRESRGVLWLQLVGTGGRQGHCSESVSSCQPSPLCISSPIVSPCAYSRLSFQLSFPDPVSLRSLDLVSERETKEHCVAGQGGGGKELGLVAAVIVGVECLGGEFGSLVDRTGGYTMLQPGT